MSQNIWNSPSFSSEFFNYEHVYKRIIESTPEGGRIVEVGCWKGASTMFLTLEAIKKKISVFAVDTWLGSVEHKEIDDVKNNKLFGIFLRNMMPVVDHISVIRLSSVQASRAFDDESLDAVFIDADHSYQAVKDDINCWLPKVKKSGILAGHDYIDSFEGVIRAVDEMLPRKEIITCPSNNKCWLFVK